MAIELTRADFPEAVRLVGRCTEPGCPEHPREQYDETRAGAVAWLRGWFTAHVIATGHRVVIEEKQVEG